MVINVRSKEGQIIKVIKNEPASMGLRVSIGGSIEKGYYIAVMGNDWEEAEEMLEETLIALKKAKIIDRKKNR